MICLTNLYLNSMYPCIYVGHSTALQLLGQKDRNSPYNFVAKHSFTHNDDGSH